MAYTLIYTRGQWPLQGKTRPLMAILQSGNSCDIVVSYKMIHFVLYHSRRYNKLARPNFMIHYRQKLYIPYRNHCDNKS
jgi:hypothetical protein